MFEAITSKNFSESFKILVKKKKEKGLALDDILIDVHALLMKSKLEDK